MSAKLFKIFPKFYEILLKQSVWMLDDETFRTIMVNKAKTLLNPLKSLFLNGFLLCKLKRAFKSS